MEPITPKRKKKLIPESGLQSGDSYVKKSKSVVTFPAYLSYRTKSEKSFSTQSEFSTPKLVFLYEEELSSVLGSATFYNNSSFIADEFNNVPNQRSSSVAFAEEIDGLPSPEVKGESEADESDEFESDVETIRNSSPGSGSMSYSGYKPAIDSAMSIFEDVNSEEGNSEEISAEEMVFDQGAGEELTPEDSQPEVDIPETKIKSDSVPASQIGDQLNNQAEVTSNNNESETSNVATDESNLSVDIGDPLVRLEPDNTIGALTESEPESAAGSDSALEAEPQTAVEHEASDPSTTIADLAENTESTSDDNAVEEFAENVQDESHAEPSEASVSVPSGTVLLGPVVRSIRQRASRLPTGEITAGTEASRRAEVIAGRAREGQEAQAQSVSDSASEAMPPLPEDLPASILSEDNPVPSITTSLDSASNLPLPDQTPPQLEQSPQDNWPVLGSAPVSPGTLRRLREIDLETPPVGEEEERQREGLLALRERLMTPPEVVEGYTGVVPDLIDIPPPEHPIIPERNKTRLSQALARLLENPTRVAQNMVQRARGSAFVGGILNQLPETQSLGDSDMVPEFAEVLGLQLDEIRIEAGIAAEDVDREVENRRSELDRQHAEQEEVAHMSLIDERAEVADANQLVADTVAGARRGMDEQTEEVQASMGGESRRAAIEGRRDRIVADISRHVGTENAEYRRAGETRERELNTSETAQINAYRFAAQQDEFQLTQNRQQIEPTESELSRTPRGTEPIDFALQDRIARSNSWRDRRIRAVRASFTTLKTQATNATNEHRTGIDEAGEQSREKVRVWAEEELGEETSWWDSIVNMINDWMGEAEAEAQAWETVQNQETAVIASGYVDMIGQVERSAAAGITQEQMLARSDLSTEERAIINAYFNPPDGGTARDPIGAVAFGLRERIYSQRGGELKTRFESDVKNNQPWDVLDRVGRAYTSSFDAANRASQLNAAFEPGLTGLGTEEEEVFTALAGLNPVQAKAVRMAYEHFYHRTLESALNSEMDTDGEANRARALLSGDQSAADAAALHMAMSETFLGTGLGTDRDIVMNTLRNKTPEEIEAITAAYESTYPGDGNLRQLLREELNDWSTLSTHDSDMAMAYMDSNTPLADAIAIDQSMHGFTWGYAFNLAYGTDFEEGGRDEFTAVTDRIRQEVAAQAATNEWDERQFQAELSRRLSEVESTYNQEYSYHGSLREAVSERFDEGPNRDLLTATLDNDEIRADAARIAIERYESIVYASDDVIIDVVERRYDRALEAERRDRGPFLRQEMETQLAREDDEFFRQHGRYFSGDERYARQQELEVAMERQLESSARERAMQDTQRMDEVFSQEYGDAHGESLAQAVEVSTSGTSGEHAVAALSQGGYLDRYQRFQYAVGGYLDGTEEDDLARALEGATPQEIAEMEARWALEHPGETLEERALSETSGTDNMDTQVALLGRPMTVDQALERERLRVQLEQPTNWFGEQIAGPEREILNHRMSEMEANAATLREPVRTQEDRARRDHILGEFQFNQEAIQSAVQQHRARVSAITDAVANTASMVVAIAVGALITAVTGGSAGPVAIALIASLAATMTSIGTRALLMGNQYGQEEFFTDVAIGVVDAIVAAATAGIGNRLLGISQVSRAVSGGAVRSGMRGTLQRIQRGLAQMLSKLGDVGPLARRVQTSAMLQNMTRGPWYKQLAAHAIAESVENAVGALPTAIVGEVINDKNWEGGFQFGTALGNVGTAVGMGVGMGLGMSGGMAAMGHISSFARSRMSGPRIGSDIHFTSPDHLPTNDAQYHAALDEYRSRPNSDGTPRTQADFDTALQRERRRHFEDFSRRNPGKTEADFNAELQQHATARRTEFEEMHGGRKDFDVEAGREAGEQIQKVETERQQRQSYAEELNDAAPQGRSDLGEIPVSILSEAEFKRLGASGDSAVVMRDGQAHLVVKEGADPQTVRQHAESLANMTAEGTGGRSVDPSHALPKDLRGRVNVDVNPDLPARSVEVHYESHNGIIIGVWVEVGPGARAIDIQMHAGTVRSMRRLQGISGQIRKIIERMRRWTRLNPTPPPGTKAFEARLEMEKLPAIIQERANALRNASTPAEQVRLMAEVEHLRAQMESHARFVDAVEAEPGLGYVAAKDLSEAQISNRIEKVSDPDARAALAELPFEEQTQLLHYHALIEDATRGLNSPGEVRAAVDSLVQSWRSIRDIVGKIDDDITPRLMNRAMSSEDAISFLADTRRIGEALDSVDAKRLLNDIAFMSEVDVPGQRVSDIVRSASRLLDQELPGELNAQLMRAAIDSVPADRARVMNGLTQIAEMGDEVLLRGIADRLNGNGGRSAMGTERRGDYLGDILDLINRSNILAESQPQYRDIVRALILGATDAHLSDRYFGRANEFLDGLTKHITSHEANSISSIKQLLDPANFDDPAIKALIGNAAAVDASAPINRVGLGDAEFRSSRALIEAIQRSDAAQELGSLSALLRHLADEGIRNRDSIGKSLSGTMDSIIRLIDDIDPDALPPHLRGTLAEIEATVRDFQLKVDDTFSFREGERRIPDELYDILREGTPSKEVRDKVAAEPGPTYTDEHGNPMRAPPPFDDPVFDHPDNTTRMQVNETLEADHIVPMAQIAKMPNFELLTTQQQLEILNYSENFMALSKSANASKGDSSFADWDTHATTGSKVNEAFRQRMIIRERELQIELQRMIDIRAGIISE